MWAFEEHWHGEALGRVLEASRAARRTTRFMVRKLWEPVGAQVMPKAETTHLVSTLFGGTAGRVVSDRIDRRVDALPGLAGLALMQGALTEYGGVEMAGAVTPARRAIAA